jgi:hypothetical protein
MSTSPIQTFGKLAANSLCNQPIEVSLMMNEIGFLENLPIAEPQKYEDLTAATDVVQVNLGSLCSFSEKLSAQNREDVMNSTLFAQLAANKEHDRFLKPKDWYKTYFDVLGMMGWNIPIYSFHDISPKTPINWEDLALEGLKVPGVMEQAKKAIEMAKALTMNSKAMKIWSANSSNGNNGNFQIISFMPVSGTVVATTSGLIFQSTMSQGQFLSWSTNFTIRRVSVKAELNEEIYGKCRQLIIEKLHDKDAPTTSVANVP